MLAATETAHRCTAALCCDSAPARPGPSFELAVMFGLGKRNEELRAEGLPRIGILRDSGRGIEIWLSRQAPARTFTAMRAASAWASEHQIRLLRVPGADA